jgi:RNA polymerase sigma-70 factor (ECF subfamily)
LIARAENSYGIAIDSVCTRVTRALEKYLLADVPNPDSPRIASFIDAVHADDFCLVLACENGNEQAWTDLMSRFGATVRSAARSVAGNEDAADDLAQSIWAELYGLRARDGKAGGKLGYYSGRGSLGGWLRAVVGQLAIDQHRKQSRFVQAEDDSDLDRISNASDDRPQGQSSTNVSPDPESVFLADKSAFAIEQSLAKAIKSLEAEDRLLVKLYYFDGLKLREAGAVLGVHEATASRRLSKIQLDIRKRVEESLKHELRWSSAEITEGLSRSATVLQADVEAMISGPGPPGESAGVKL